MGDKNKSNVLSDKEYERISPDEIEVISPNSETIMSRSTRFTEESFTDTTVMVYEKSNAFALSYYGISRIEQSLLLAGLVSARNVNRANPYTQAEKEAGIQCHVPIAHVARMMGYDVDNKKLKSYYSTIKAAAIKLTNSASILLENEDKTQFSVFNLISQVDYNLNNDGRISFKFSPGASPLFIDNKDKFALYSLILKNKMEKLGATGAVRLHEALKTDFYKAESSKTGTYDVYYDFVDFKCKLYLINTNNKTVIDILTNPRYSLERIQSNDNLAYERALAIEELDAPTKETIANIKNSKEYKEIQLYKKTDEYKAALAKMKKMSPDDSEYDSLYNDKIKRVVDMEKRLQNQLNSIVCQYNEWGDFRKRILVPAQKAFLETFRDTDLMDMMFEYKPYRYKGKVIGIYFTLFTIEAYKQKEKSKGVQISIFDYIKEKEEMNASLDTNIYDEIGGADKVNPGGMAGKKRGRKKGSGNVQTILKEFEDYINNIPEEKRISFSASEMYAICKLTDIETIKEKYNIMISQSTDIESPVAWMTAAIKNNYPASSGDGKRKSSGAATQFNQMMEQNYNFEELEKEILAN